MKAPLVVNFAMALSSLVALASISQRKRIGDILLFFQWGEQEEVARSKVKGVGRMWKRRNVMFHQKFICGDSPVGRGIVLVQDSIAGAQILRAMSTHSVAEALQDCFVQFLIYRLSSRDVLMINQPVKVEERKQMILALDFTCRAIFGRGVDAVFHREDICFVSGPYP
jgi:hypothetical protein